jgi:beta-glucosidase
LAATRYGDSSTNAKVDGMKVLTRSVVDEIDLRESYLPAWQAAIMEASASGVMCRCVAPSLLPVPPSRPTRSQNPLPFRTRSYNEINGVPACCNGELLRGALEGDWGLTDGFVISDADAVALEGFVPDQGSYEVGGHNYTSSLLESAVAALKNGTTVSLEDTDPESAAYLLELPRALALGRVGRADLEEAARRALTPRFRVGLYDADELVPWNRLPASVIESAAHHALARRAAAESFVLLQNAGGTLPLADPAQGGPSTIAVVGSAADCASCQVNRYSGHPNVSVSFFAGVRDAALARGAAAVTLSASFDAVAVAAVAAADLAVVVFTSQDEGESKDREHIGLPDEQIAFLAALAAAGSTTPVVAVIASGGAVDSSPALAASAAALAVYTGGMEAGSALADVLYGVVNPSGALAHTVYRSSWESASDFLSMAVRAPPGRGRRYLTPAAAAAHVLFPLGFGLSYSTWSAEIASVAPASVSAAALEAGANVTVTVTVRNTGDVAGARVAFVLLTRSAADPAEQWPSEWLPRAGFAKLHNVEPGAAASATLVVGARDLARWDTAAHAFTVRAGSYSLAARDADAGEAATLVVTA